VLSYLVAGLVSGAVYAMSSMGVVLTYNASRTFNFAQGGMAFFIAYCFYWLRTEMGLPTVLALVISVLVTARRWVSCCGRCCWASCPPRRRWSGSPPRSGFPSRCPRPPR
jgi:branched-subunit amino acid ABC-type transport system permease component